MDMKYPPIHNIVCKLKQGNKEKAVMYKELVEIETSFILKVIEDIYTRFKDIKILTCHDAIYVPLSFEYEVQKIWDAHLKELTKVLPQDTLKDEAEENLNALNIFGDDDEDDDLYFDNQLDNSKKRINT
jgi:hypothetical protein